MKELDFQKQLLLGLKKRKDIIVERRNAGTSVNPYTGNYMSSGKSGKCDIFGTASYTCACGRECTGVHWEAELKASGATMSAVSTQQTLFIREQYRQKVRAVVVAPSKATEWLTPSVVAEQFCSILYAYCGECQPALHIDYIEGLREKSTRSPRRVMRRKKVQEEKLDLGEWEEFMSGMSAELEELFASA